MFSFKKMLSYIIPVKLDSGYGQDGVRLDVYYDLGKIKLFTDTTNYSGGKLKKLFRKALKSLTFKGDEDILVLGFGMGSIWEIVREEYGLTDVLITGVDYEPLVKQYIEKYVPKIIKDTNTYLNISDALAFLETNAKTYNYILIDLFQNDCVADVVLDRSFIKNIFTHCNKHSIVVLNTMNMLDNNLDVYKQYFEIIDSKHLEKTNVVYYLKAK